MRDPIAESMKLANPDYDADTWATPWSIYNQLDAEFHFTLDVCASEWNHKHKNYFDKEKNSLVQQWAPHICWMNPPYSEMPLWMNKAWQEAKRGATVVCLIPARTDTNWWHDYAMEGEIRFLRGRVQFIAPPGRAKKHNSPNFGSAIVIFRPNQSA